MSRDEYLMPTAWLTGKRKEKEKEKLIRSLNS